MTRLFFLKWSVYTYLSSSSSFSGTVTQLSCLCFIQVQIQEFADLLSTSGVQTCEQVCGTLFWSHWKGNKNCYDFTYTYTLIHCTSCSVIHISYTLGLEVSKVTYTTNGTRMLWFSQDLQSTECMEITCAPVSQSKIMFQGKKGA